VVTVVHSNKDNGSNPLLRVSGSIGITGAARSVLIAAADPEDEHRNILAVAGGNYSAPVPALAYRIVGADLGEDIVTNRVEWLGERPDVDINALLVERNPEEHSLVRDAMEYLEGLQLDVVARDLRIIKAGAESLDVSEKSLQRARRRLGIPSWMSEGFPAVPYWGPKDAPRVDNLNPVHPVHPGVTSGNGASAAQGGQLVGVVRPARDGAELGPVLAHADYVEAVIEELFGGRLGDFFSAYRQLFRSVPHGTADVPVENLDALIAARATP
jgi:hypothetical protein